MALRHKPQDDPCSYSHWIIRDGGMTLRGQLIMCRNGDVVRYQRNESDRWQARLKTSGKLEPASRSCLAGAGNRMANLRR